MYLRATKNHLSRLTSDSNLKALICFLLGMAGGVMLITGGVGQ